MPEMIAARSDPEERCADAPPANWLTAAPRSDAGFCRPLRSLRWNAETSTEMTPSRPDPTRTTRVAIGAAFFAARQECHARRPSGADVVDRTFQRLGVRDHLAQFGLLIAAHQRTPLRACTAGEIEQLGLLRSHRFAGRADAVGIEALGGGLPRCCR